MLDDTLLQGSLKVGHNQEINILSKTEVKIGYDQIYLGLISLDQACKLGQFDSILDEFHVVWKDELGPPSDQISKHRDLKNRVPKCLICKGYYECIK